MTLTNIIAWIVLGAIAGFIANLLVKGGSWGVIGTIVLGIIGAFVGGWLADALNIGRPVGGSDVLNVYSVVVAVVGAVIVIVVVNLLTRRKYA